MKARRRRTCDSSGGVICLIVLLHLVFLTVWGANIYVYYMIMRDDNILTTSQCARGMVINHGVDPSTCQPFVNYRIFDSHDNLLPMIHSKIFVRDIWIPGWNCEAAHRFVDDLVTRISNGPGGNIDCVHHSDLLPEPFLLLAVDDSNYIVFYLLLIHSWLFIFMEVMIMTFTPSAPQFVYSRGASFRSFFCLVLSLSTASSGWVWRHKCSWAHV